MTGSEGSTVFLRETTELATRVERMRHGLLDEHVHTCPKSLLRGPHMKMRRCKHMHDIYPFGFEKVPQVRIGSFDSRCLGEAFCTLAIEITNGTNRDSGHGSSCIHVILSNVPRTDDGGRNWCVCHSVLLCSMISGSRWRNASK